MDVLKEQQWALIALVFFGIIGYISWLRRRDRRWIEKRFSGEQVMAMSFGVNYFGRASEPTPPRRSSGFLLLLPDRLFYRSRFSKVELEIPGPSIRRIYHGTSHKGVELHQSLMKLDFINENGEADTAAFRVPYPPQWMQAIDNRLLRRKDRRRDRS